MENELNINNKKNKRGDAVEKVTECPECGSRHLAQDYDRGELICEDCGLVIDNQYIDEGPEWRAFDMKQEENRARTGAPMTQMVHDKGLSTGIDSSNRDSYGRSIPSKKKAQIYRLRKWQRRIRVSDATERNLAYALTEMDRMASTMGLPKNIRETAAVIYRKAVKKNLIRGRSINSVVAASLYAACRKAGVPRTLDEIAEATSSDRKEIGRTYRFLSRELVLKLKPTKPQEYLSRFCSELGLSGKVQKLAKNIIDKAEDRELISGKGPTGLAAASIYIASINANERRTQR
ncbi:MAG: transcription initiation factor IIB, partial [Candidatus Saliniplasma sp.]